MQEDIVVAAITSNITEKEYSITINNDDMDEGMLKVVSCVRADKIYTLSKFIVVKKFGRLKTSTMEKVIFKINELLRESPR
ncbi:MAG: type II toxin-antitoxin system PemK/MazF family toxin [Caloramator sp.]|nr:type II toxin-antitoxin system PemK/MazF family toxin [Caloramator sp.]